MKDAFKKIDTNGDGFVTPDELKKLLIDQGEIDHFSFIDVDFNEGEHFMNEMQTLMSAVMEEGKVDAMKFIDIILGHDEGARQAYEEAQAAEDKSQDSNSEDFCLEEDRNRHNAQKVSRKERKNAKKAEQEEEK